MAGVDFVSTNGVLTLAPGDPGGAVAVSLLPNAAHGGAATFFVSLSDLANATLADGQGMATIVQAEIRSIRLAGAAVEVRIGSASGWRYTLERSAALDLDVDWREVTGAVGVSGTGGVLVLADANVPAGSAQFFYRVRLLSP